MQVSNLNLRLAEILLWYTRANLSSSFSVQVKVKVKAKVNSETVHLLYAWIFTLFFGMKENRVTNVCNIPLP